MDGLRLRNLRKDKKLTQAELGKILNVSKVSISGYESGDRSPDTDNLRKMADYFNVTTDYLLGRSDDPNQTEDENFDSLKELNRLFDKYEVKDAGFLDIDKWKEMTSEDLRSLEDYFEYLYTKSKNSKHKNKDHEEVDDL